MLRKDYEIECILDDMDEAREFTLTHQDGVEIPSLWDLLVGCNLTAEDN